MWKLAIVLRKPSWLRRKPHAGVPASSPSWSPSISQHQLLESGSESLDDAPVTGCCLQADAARRRKRSIYHHLSKLWNSGAKIIVLSLLYIRMYFPGGAVVRFTCQCRGHVKRRFNPWVKGRCPRWKKCGPLPSILAWNHPWTEEPGKPRSWGHKNRTPLNCHPVLPLLLIGSLLCSNK